MAVSADVEPSPFAPWRTLLRPPWAVIAAAIGLTPLAALALAALLGDDGGEMARLARVRLWDLAATSALVTGLSASGAAVLGVGLGWLAAMHRFPGRAVLSAALYLPLAIPAYVAAYAYLDLTTAAGPLQTWLREATGWRVGAYVFPEVRGPLGAAFIFSLCFYPYVYALARRAFSEQGAPMMEAARSLGCGPWAAFQRTALPLARPALAAGGALAALESLADYGAVSHLGAPTFTVGVMRAWSAAGEPIAAARLAVLLVIVCLGFLWVERAARGRLRVAGGARSTRRHEPSTLTGWRGIAALSACIGVLSLALVIPAVHLTALAVEAGPARGVGAAALRTAGLGAAAAVLLGLIGFGLASAARMGDGGARAMRLLTTAGYATPGAAAALGVLALAGASQAAFGLAATGAVLGPALLLLAYQTRFSAAALSPIAASLERAPLSVDHAARVMGADRGALARRVHLPLAMGGAATAALLVFVEVVKELPATIILRPFDFDTLAVLAHSYASQERLGQAASPALAIVAVCVPAMAAAAWLMRARDGRPRAVEEGNAP